MATLPGSHSRVHRPGDRLVLRQGRVGVQERGRSRALWSRWVATLGVLDALHCGHVLVAPSLQALNLHGGDDSTVREVKQDEVNLDDGNKGYAWVQKREKLYA